MPGYGDSPVRVLYVLFRYPQVSQTFVRDEIAALRARGAQVTVLSLEPGDPAEAVGAEWPGAFEQLERPSSRRALADHLWLLRRHPRRHLAFLARVAFRRDHWRMALARTPSAARRLLDDPPQHCHTHFAWTTATVAGHFAVLLGVPLSITVHAKDIYTVDPPVLRRRLAPFRDIVTVCHYNVGFLTGAGVVRTGDSRVRMIPCGVEVPEQATVAPRTDVLAVGRLVEKKGFDTLIEAAAVVARSRPDLSVCLVGDGPERERLEALARRLGIDSRVTFLGAQAHAETLERMLDARVLCLPARRASDGDTDAMPVVLREAMVRGVPVIASRLTGIPENVGDEAGWLVEPGSVRDLIAALNEALDDEDGRARRGRQARERVRRSATLERQAEELAGMFAASPA
jgi:colanic acid/amylovoran biosynthesis glycosyltransferase